LFSKTKNVTLGGSSKFDENALFEHKPVRNRTTSEDRRDPEAGDQPPAVDAGTLVPWIRLAPAPAAAP
jgi:hypothetical protein